MKELRTTRESGPLSMRWIIAGARGDPAPGSTEIPVLTPLVVPGQTRSSWDAKRFSLREEWVRVLGPFPDRCELNVEILEEERLEDHRRLLVCYETEPGCRAEAYLLEPARDSGPVPAAVVFHGTSSEHILLPAGLAGPQTRHLGLHLVRRGYAVLCPRCFIFGYGEEGWLSEGWIRDRDARDFRAASDRLFENYPRWSGMGKMLWDGLRAVDYLETRPEIDTERIVAVGHSLGAKEALYLAAFDDRIRAAVSSEGGIGLALSNWDGPWYLGDRVEELRSHRRDHHELLALAAPRPFLLLGGGESDGEKSLPWLNAAAPVYSLYNKPDNLGLLLHNAGHDIPDPVREAAFDWLEKAVSP